MRGSSDGCGCFPTGRHYAAIAHLLKTRVQGLAPDVKHDERWIDHDIVMIDVETTGREASLDRIVELAIVRGKNGEIVSRDAWLINPQRAIPAEVTAVHGITDADVKDKPIFADVCQEILKALAKAIPGAYNAPFDRGFLHAEVERAKASLEPQPAALLKDVEWLDPLIWARHVQANQRSRALGEVAARLGVQLENAHRATADAEAALKILYKFAADGALPAGYGHMIQEQIRLGRAQDEARLMWRGRGN